jgi:ADP-ribose pyrophosphatase YjhB (NUDIX family)
LRIVALRQLYRAAYWAMYVRGLLLPPNRLGVKCLITRGGDVLLVRHTYGRRRVWYLPGGGVHRGEAAVAAAAREMGEELGLGGVAWRELATVLLQLERGLTTIVCVYAELPDRRLQWDPVEIAEARWFALEALPAPLGVEVAPLLELLPGQARG